MKGEWQGSSTKFEPVGDSMSTVQLPKKLMVGLIGFILIVFVSMAEAQEIKQSSMDGLFRYPGILEQQDDGAFLKVDYDKMRDLHQRDEVPELHVKGKYVDLGIKPFQAFETLQADGRTVDVYRAGQAKNSTFAVIFIHGRGGDRKLGSKDFTFGGNFNRLKNIAVDNQGVYYAPTIRSFDSEGVADTAALIGYVRSQSPGARIILSCASMGSIVCWGITEDQAAVANLSGMMVMGGVTDPSFSKSPAFKRKLPIFFSHGSLDEVYPATDQIGLYKTLIGQGYPTRFVLFNTGSHGTPIRMTDWRETLNWFLGL